MVKRLVAQKIGFTPTLKQKVLFAQAFGGARVVYNEQVAAFNTYDKATNPEPHYLGVSEIKSKYEWFKENPVPSNALSNTILDFRKARTAYFSKKTYHKNRPQFKKRHDSV